MLGRRTRLKKAAVLLTPLLMAATVSPADDDEYVCTPSKAVECDADLNCGPPAPQVAPATFFHVDLDAGVITLLGPAERRGETTQIRYMERDGDRLIMGGAEAGRAWSMIMYEGGGRMTLTVNFGDAGWVVFGQCIAEDELSP